MHTYIHTSICVKYIQKESSGKAQRRTGRNPGKPREALGRPQGSSEKPKDARENAKKAKEAQKSPGKPRKEPKKQGERRKTREAKYTNLQTQRSQKWIEACSKYRFDAKIRKIPSQRYCSISKGIIQFPILQQSKKKKPSQTGDEKRGGINQIEFFIISRRRRWMYRVRRMR